MIDKLMEIKRGVDVREVFLEAKDSVTWENIGDYIKQNSAEYTFMRGESNQVSKFVEENLESFERADKVAAKSLIILYSSVYDEPHQPNKNQSFADAIAYIKLLKLPVDSADIQKVSAIPDGKPIKTPDKIKNNLVALENVMYEFFSYLFNKYKDKLQPAPAPVPEIPASAESIEILKMDKNDTMVEARVNGIRYIFNSNPIIINKFTKMVENKEYKKAIDYIKSKAISHIKLGV